MHACILFAHLWLFLAGRWWLSLRTAVGFTRINTDISSLKFRDSANYWVHVMAPNHGGCDRVVPLLRVPSMGTLSSISIADVPYTPYEYYFEFQKSVFVFRGNSASSNSIEGFEALPYLAIGVPRSFAQWRGHSSDANVETASAIWGKNEFDIPLPEFMDLYMVPTAKLIAKHA